MDGIDVAMIETDGERVTAFLGHRTHTYAEEFRGQLRALIRTGENRASVERALTDQHISIVRAFLKNQNIAGDDVDLIGFHGHTIDHAPAEGRTVQIGDAARLAEALGISVIADFRANDVASGGEGAPFAPIFHHALAAELALPVAVLNIGGVANVTWIGDEGAGTMLAFDTGPGNALIDDWMREKIGRPYDAEGALAASGKVDTITLERLMTNEYFLRPPPKSLDRNDFVSGLADGFDAADGAATLTEFTVETIGRASAHFPSPVNQWIVCGGGRHNRFMMARLAAKLDAPVAAAEQSGWLGDAIEAQAFAFMAVRSERGLALSYPGTTGVSTPTSGGVRFDP